MSREEKKRETRCRIIEAAKRLFSEKGYESTTVAQITEEAGVAKGTFFNYFENKDEIMCDLQGQWAFEQIAMLRDKPGPVTPRMNALLVELGSRMDMNRQLARAMFQSAASGPEAVCLQDEIYRKLYEGLAPVMAAGQECGEFTKVIPAWMLAQMAVQTYYGVLLHFSLGQGDDRLSEQLALTFQIFFRGIAPER
jgi:AcrR family transcriptional regulator